MVSRKQNDEFITVKDEHKHYLDTNYSDLMKQFYLDYSVSVLVSRAIPDVRDGLKPVQRKILYDMYEMGVLSNKPYKKSARIVGDTMGKYHPHGDSSIYDAMVNMAVDFNKTQKMVDGFGNMGSIEGDEAAAMRYTESRLDNYTELVMLDYLKYNTVNFIDNYDGSEKEPEVLPALLPNLIINGSSGIGVGSRSEIPSHNLKEVIDATIYTMKHKRVNVEKLMNFIKGPDFPSGGIVTNKSDLLNVYKNGYGKIEISGVMEEKNEGGKKQLVITEIPQTMVGDGINKFIEKLKSLVLDKTLSEVTDISNHSSSEGIMIVIDLKKNADAEYVKSVIYNKTPFKWYISTSFLVVENGAPVQKSLLDLINSFIGFQYEIYTKKFKNLLEKSSEKMEITEGLIKAIDQLDAILDLIRNSKSTAVAKKALMSGSVENINFKLKKNKDLAQKFNFTEKQADAILKMQLSRLVGLEINELKKNHKKYLLETEKYTEILNDDTKLQKEIIATLNTFKKKYSKDRKTLIENLSFEEKEKKVEKEDLVVLVDKNSYIYSITKDLFDKKDKEFLDDYSYIIKTTNLDSVLVFTNKNNAHSIKVSEIPYSTSKNKAVPIDNISNFDINKESVLNIFNLDNDSNMDLIFLTQNGLIKSTNIKEFISNRKTINASKINDDDQLSAVKEYEDNKNIIITTNDNKGIRFDISEIPSYGKNAAGVKGLKLNGEEIANDIFIVEKTNGELLINDIQKRATDIKIGKRGATPTKIK